MPNKNTFLIKPVKHLLEKEITEGKWLDPYANDNTILKIIHKRGIDIITNDLDPRYKNDYNLDALTFLQQFEENSIDGILFDPPYSPEQTKRKYDSIGLKLERDDTNSHFWLRCIRVMSKIIKPNGKAICFGWNSSGIGKKYHFDIIKIILINHGSYRNDTIITINKKRNNLYNYVKNKGCEM